MIMNKISPKFISKGSINDISALVETMAWRHPGDKPLFEPTIVLWIIYTLLSLNELSCKKYAQKA